MARGGLGAGLLFYWVLRLCWYFLMSLGSFGGSWGGSRLPCLWVMGAYRFACGERGISLFIRGSRGIMKMIVDLHLFKPNSWVARQVVKQLVYTMLISNNRASFHLWWKENFVKHQKVSKYHGNDCRSAAFLEKLAQMQVVFCEFCSILQNAFFTETSNQLLLNTG